MTTIPKIKYVVKTFTITGTQKILFQVRHPENYGCLTGIAATSDYKSRFAADIIGDLSFAIPETGDVIFNELVHQNYPSSMETTTDPSDVYDGDIFLATHLKQGKYFDTNIPIAGAMMEGFLESFFDPTVVRAGDSITQIRITIYLRYERRNNKEEKNDSPVCA